MNFADLKEYNPKLYFDGICRGKIPLSNLNPLSPGNPSSPPFIEGILGGPKPPENYSFDYSGNNIPIGPSGTYPKPWRSAAQFIQDGSYGSQIGPYARFVKFADNDLLIPDTCVSGQKSGKCGSSGGGGIWGRVGLGAGGDVLAFYAQDWYNQSEGTYNAAYWSNHFNLTGNAAWQSKKSWWESCSKATIIIETGFDPYRPAEIEVAYASPQFNDPEYYQGLDLASYPDYSLDLTLLTVMVSVAALARWVL
jgi:hypothetical protein